jgi:hypothetical protein
MSRPLKFRAWDAGGETIGGSDERPSAMLKVVEMSFNRPREVVCDSYENILPGKHTLNAPKYRINSELVKEIA